MKKWLRISALAGILIMIQSCGVNSNWLLRTQRDYEFAPMDSLNESKKDYKIAVNDILNMSFFTNDGIKILDLTSGEGGNQTAVLNQNNTLNYIIQSDSLVKLPVIGKVNLVGMTIREAELYVQEKYSAKYVDPFVQINVTNRRVVVFPGNGGDAQVIYLANNNTTLMEVLALAGGVTDRGRAARIKLIRKNDEGKREVYKVDLSTIEGLAYTDILVQANDYIYVDPVPEIGKEVLSEVAPIVSLISSAAVIIALVTTP